MFNGENSIKRASSEARGIFLVGGASEVVRRVRKFGVEEESTIVRLGKVKGGERGGSNSSELRTGEKITSANSDLLSKFLK